MARTSYTICLLPGDGIGVEIMDAAVGVLDAISKASGIRFVFDRQLLGGCAIDEAGDPYPPATQRAAHEADAVLLGAVGGPKWDSTDPCAPRPEVGLLAIRKDLGLFANMRPVRVQPDLVGSSPLRPEVIQGADLIVVRELTGGLYFGARERTYDEDGAGANGEPGQHAIDTLDYREYEVERIVRRAFEVALRRRRRLVSVDKANVLETSRLWREVVHRIAREYPQVECSDMLVDNAAMQLIRDPRQFDVIVTENTFGDILSDEASMLSGSLGLLASASLGERAALFEPSHGSAPDIAGQDIANPVAQILSVEMMLRYAFGLQREAAAVASAVDSVLAAGWRTRDLADADTPDDRIVGCAQMGSLIAHATHQALVE